MSEFRDYIKEDVGFDMGQIFANADSIVSHRSPNPKEEKELLSKLSKYKANDLKKQQKIIQGLIKHFKVNGYENEMKKFQNIEFILSRAVSAAKG